MQNLQLDKVKFYRIKRGQTVSDAERELCCPVKHGFAGAVVCAESCTTYSVKPFDSYKSIAESFGVEEERLKEFNFGRIIYPTRVIYVPNLKRD